MKKNDSKNNTRKFLVTRISKELIVEGREQPVKVYRIRAAKTFPLLPEGFPCRSIYKGELGGWVSGPHNLSQEGACWIFDEAAAIDDSLVSDDARLHDYALIMDNVRVCGNSMVSIKATIRGSAKLQGKTVVRDQATVGGNAETRGSTIVVNNAVVRGGSRLDDTRVEDNAVIDGTCTVTDAYISGNAYIGGAANVRRRACVKGKARVTGYSDVPSKAVVGGNALLSDSKHCFVAYPVGSEDGVLTVYKTKQGLGVTRGCFVGTKATFLKAVKKKYSEDCPRLVDEYTKLIKVAESRITAEDRP